MLLCDSKLSAFFNVCLECNKSNFIVLLFNLHMYGEGNKDEEQRKKRKKESKKESDTKERQKEIEVKRR